MDFSLQLCAYIAVMAAVTYLLRMAPLVLFRKRISSRFVRGMLYYMPYAVLSAMTVPSVFASTGNFFTALVGLAVALILAFLNRSLITVAVGASLGALIAGFFI